MNKKHMILMVLCCVVGMGAVAAITLFRVPVNNVVTIGMLLLCPLSHFLMMGMMGKDHNHDHGSAQDPACHDQPVVDAKAKPASAPKWISGQD